MNWKVKDFSSFDNFRKAKQFLTTCIFTTLCFNNIAIEIPIF